MNTNDLRQTIANKMEAHGISAYALSQLSGVPDSTVRDYLNGKDTTTERYLLLCEALGLRLSVTSVGKPKTSDLKPVGRPPSRKKKA